MSERLDNRPPARSQREDRAEGWSTPIDIRIASALVLIVGAFLFLNGVVESLLHSAEVFQTGYRRVIVSIVAIVAFIFFWLYVRHRKPYWRGWHGYKEKLERPKLRHILYMVGVLCFVWLPTVPGLMPTAHPEQATKLEVPKEPSASLMASYDITRKLPISIPPGSTAHVVELIPRLEHSIMIPVGDSAISNHSSDAMLWPSALASNKPSDSYIACELANHGEKAVLHVILIFDIDFLEAVPLSRNNQGANEDRPWSRVPFPPEGGAATEDYISGRIVYSEKRQIVVGAIDPHMTTTVDLVNRSQFFAKVYFPDVATLQIAGESKVETTELIRPDTSLADIWPYHILAPSAANRR